MTMRLSKQPLEFIPLEAGLEINLEEGILYGVQVAMLGPARGHGMELDSTTLDQIVSLGNKVEKGVKARFGHPTECSPGLGTFIGTRTNFRRDGRYVRADLHLSPAASGNYREHVLKMAQLHPEKLGNSVVVTGERVYRQDQDGARLRGEDGKELPPVLRVNELHAVDVVDEPAAGDGMFSEPVDGVTFSPRTMAELKQALARPGFVERAYRALLGRRSVAWPEEDEGADPEVSEMEEGDMSLTLKDFKEQHPGVAKEHADELSAGHATALASAETRGAETARAQIVRFLSKCEAHNFEPEKDMPKGFAFHAIEKALSYEECLEGLVERKGKRATLSALEEASQLVGGQSADAPEGNVSAQAAADEALRAAAAAQKNGGA